MGADLVDHKASRPSRMQRDVKLLGRVPVTTDPRREPVTRHLRLHLARHCRSRHRTSECSRRYPRATLRVTDGRTGRLGERCDGDRCHQPRGRPLEWRRFVQCCRETERTRLASCTDMARALAAEKQIHCPQYSKRYAMGHARSNHADSTPICVSRSAGPTDVRLEGTRWHSVRRPKNGG